MRKLLVIIVCFVCLQSLAQNCLYIKVHFLYGSKPHRNAFKEKNWFGGLKGGHVGVEIDSNKILNFSPKGSFHVIESKRKFHSKFSLHNFNDFYSIFKTDAKEVKKAIVVIPITHEQKKVLDSIANAYLNQTPYDYAFWGMRCAAAAYDILSKINIVKPYHKEKIMTKIFYPQLLRKKILAEAKKNNWTVLTEKGSSKRKWEQD